MSPWRAGILGNAPRVVLPCACRCAFSTGTVTFTCTGLATAVLGSLSLACDAAEGLLGNAPRVLLPCACRGAFSTGTALSRVLA